MLIHRFGQTRIHRIIAFYTRDIFFLWDKWYWCFGFIRKTSLSTIFRIKVYLAIGINIDLHNNLLSFNDWAPQIHSPHWDKWIDALVSWKKLEFPAFFRVKVRLSIRIRTDSSNNSFLFMIGHHKCIPFIRVNDIDALVS